MKETSIDCPHCGRPTPDIEIRSFKGVCRYCRYAFLGAHRKWIDRPGTAEQSDSLREHPTCDTGASSFEFDYDALDKLHEELQAAPPDERIRAAEVISRLLIFCWARPDQDMRGAQIKFLAFCAGLRPELLGNLSGQELSKTLHCTKQAFSRAMLRAEKAFGVKFSRTYSLQHRETLRRIALSRASINKPKTPPAISPREKQSKTPQTVVEAPEA